MAIRIVSLIQDLASEMHDRDFLRWRREEWVSWFNEARRAVVGQRPDAYAVNRAFVCAATARQTLPPGESLLEVVGNRNGSGITPISADILDLRVPNWLNSATTNRVRHFIYRPQDPQHFYLFPRPAQGHMLDVVVSQMPRDVTISNFDTDTQEIGVDDSFANAIKYYMASRAWSKDANFAKNAGMANTNYSLFQRELGAATSADAAASPTTGE